MNNLKVLSKAEAARRKLYVLRQSLKTRAGIAPEVVNLLPALPGDQNIKKLQSDRQGKNCDVQVLDVERPEGSGPGELWIALFKGAQLVSEDWTEVPASSDDFILELSGLYTGTPGLFDLTYVINYGGVDTSSEVSRFYIDNTPPNHNNPGEAPVPPAEVIGGVLTREYLDKNIEVTMSIDTPNDAATGDSYAGYYAGVPVPPFVMGDDLTAPIVIKISTATIKGVGEGKRDFYCRYNDRVGNIGPAGDPFTFDVQLTPTPTDLKPPEAPANDDGVIDRKDSFPSLAVVIPTFSNGSPNDKAVVTFDGKEQPGVPTDGTSEVIVDVPYADVAAGGDGPRDARVTYVIDRNGKEFPEATGATVSIDLTIAGPVNPEPDPEVGNPNLDELVVKGSTKDNELVEADKGNDIAIDLDLPAGVKPGDLITLVWQGEKVAAPEGVYEVEGTEPPDFKVPLTLPSEVFEKTKNGKKKARYVITNPANGENENPSPPTEVKVYIYPVTLPDPVIQNLYVNPGKITYLNCTSLRDIPFIGLAGIIRVRPAGGSLEQGMKLLFTWSRRKLSPSEPPIDDYLIEKVLQGNEHVDGFDVYLPFTEALRPIKDGYGKIVYTAEIDEETHSSNEQEVRVVVADFDEKYCDELDD